MNKVNTLNTLNTIYNKDILEYIFIRCDDSIIPNLRLTCKKFKNIIDGKYFWMNKILYKFPCLNYKLGKNINRDYYSSLLEIFEEENLYYISAMAQIYNQLDILEILSSYKNFTHSVPHFYYFDDYKIQSEFYMSPEDNFEGRYIEYRENGNIKEICFYKNNLKNGICLLMDEENRIEEYGYYKDGKKHGKFKYFDNEIIEIKCNYYEGLLEGSFKSYINGKLFEETGYKKSSQHGVFREYYYDEEILKKEGKYNNGNRDGIWIEYDKSGNIINKFDYNNLYYI